MQDMKAIMADDEWTLVKGKRRSRSRVPRCQSTRDSGREASIPSPERLTLQEVAERAKKQQETVSSLHKEIRSSDFFRRFQAVLGSMQECSEQPEASQQHNVTAGASAQALRRWADVTQMVVYGLGSPSMSIPSRYQLAFALLVAEQLPGLMGPVEAYDPVFNDTDRHLLHSLGVKVIAQNEHGRRVATVPTLFYLPHCEASLCCNILEANASCLEKLAILGNSFKVYHKRCKAMDSSERQEKLGQQGAILRLAEDSTMVEAAVPHGEYKHVPHEPFSDMAMHLFAGSSRLGAG